MRNPIVRESSFTPLFACVSGMGFLLHLAWEYVQCSPFFLHVKVPPTVISMLSAALGDVFILWAAYIPVAIHQKSFAWPFHGVRLGGWTSFIVISIGIAGVVEYWSITTGRWSYTDSNPLFKGLGISVLPFAQMLFLNPLTILVTRNFLNRNQQLHTKEKER